MFKILKQHIFRSPYQSLAAVFVVSLSFFLISVFFLLGLGSQKILIYFESRPLVTAFLKDEIKPQETELLKMRLETNSLVKKVDYVSKEEALKIYKEQFKDNPLLLEMVTAKILPASLEISTIDLSSLKEVTDILKKEPKVEDVIFQEDVINTLSIWVKTVRQIGIVLAGFLLFISILTILVIIGMKISQRKDEIEILKLLGASGSYIKIPLYLEGITYGVFASIISFGLSILGLLYATPFLIKFLSGVPIFPIPILFIGESVVGLVLLGIIVGFLGSFFAVVRFTRSVR